MGLQPTYMLLCQSIRDDGCPGYHKIPPLRKGDNASATEKSDENDLNLESFDENDLNLLADRSRIRALFCKVNKTTTNYVRQCSSFKRPKVQKLCKTIRKNVCASQQKLLGLRDENNLELDEDSLDLPQYD